jgi:hypothetical protein
LNISTPAHVEIPVAGLTDNFTVNSIAQTYPCFQDLPKTVRMMLVTSEMLFSDETGSAILAFLCSFGFEGKDRGNVSDRESHLPDRPA